MSDGLIMGAEGSCNKGMEDELPYAHSFYVAGLGRTHYSVFCQPLFDVAPPP